MKLSPIAICLGMLLALFSTPQSKAQQEFASDSMNRQKAMLLVITSADLAKSWQPFADWKTATGRPTKVVTTEAIDKEFEGADLQAKIRECCLKHINESSTQFVVLGGDSSGDAGVVPDRDTDHSECEILPYDNIPTDLYFISEKDWDANDDGKFGVFSDDLEEVSYYNPKATIGRIPVRTEQDVKAYTDKVIEYESQYPVGDFARRMVYTCPEKDAYPKLNTSIDEVSKVWDKGNISRFFANETPWDDLKRGDHDLVPQNWVDMINQRRASKIHIHGHGLIDLWVLEKNKVVKKDSLKKLSNERAYPVITTVSCLTGQYDDKQDPCIAESMLRMPNAGAIAVLAPSREGVPFMMSSRDFRLMVTEGKMDATTASYTKFWQFALDGELTIGEAFRKVKMEMEENARKNDGFHMCQCELNLLGDPSLRLYSTPPENLRVRVRRSDDSISIRAPKNSTVCVWDGADDYQLLNTAEKGRVEAKVISDVNQYRVAVMSMGANVWFEPANDGKSVDTKPETGGSRVAEGKTIQEFRNYVSEKMSGITEQQLDEIVEVVDSNGDGVISDEEFEKRMEAIQGVLSDGG